MNKKPSKRIIEIYTELCKEENSDLNHSSSMPLYLLAVQRYLDEEWENNLTFNTTKQACNFGTSGNWVGKSPIEQEEGKCKVAANGKCEEDLNGECYYCNRNMLAPLPSSKGVCKHEYGSNCVCLKSFKDDNMLPQE